MPSILHEAPLLLIEDHPELLLHLLRDGLHLSIPAYAELTINPADHTEVVVLEGHSDKVLVLWVLDDSEPDPAKRRKPVLAVIAESQLSKDLDKLYTWLYYYAAVNKKYRCRTWLVVLCIDAEVATWASQRLPMDQPDSRFVPLVIGPGQVPRITDPTQAKARPELAVLSAIAHGEEPGGLAVARAALLAVAELPGNRAVVYENLILAALSLASINMLKELLMDQQKLYEILTQSPIYQYYGAIEREDGRREGREVAVHLLTDLCEVLGIEMTPERQAQLGKLGLAELDALRLRLKQERVWPQ